MIDWSVDKADLSTARFLFFPSFLLLFFFLDLLQHFLLRRHDGDVWNQGRQIDGTYLLIQQKGSSTLPTPTPLPPYLLFPHFLRTKDKDACLGCLYPKILVPPFLFLMCDWKPMHAYTLRIVPTLGRYLPTDANRFPTYLSNICSWHDLIRGGKVVWSGSVKKYWKTKQRHQSTEILIRNTPTLLSLDSLLALACNLNTLSFSARRSSLSLWHAKKDVCKEPLHYNAVLYILHDM